MQEARGSSPRATIPIARALCRAPPRSRSRGARPEVAQRADDERRSLLGEEKLSFRYGDELAKAGNRLLQPVLRTQIEEDVGVTPNDQSRRLETLEGGLEGNRQRRIGVGEREPSEGRDPLLAREDRL